jgi:hypothetical protein
MTGWVARAAVTAVALGQGIAPLFIDLNRTHAKNPLWPGHARFHVVWQTGTSLLLNLVVAALLWWPGTGAAGRLDFGILLTALPLLGFLAAMATRRLYGGTLRDPNGMPPLLLKRNGRSIAVDMNVVLVVVALLVLLAVAALT